MPQTPHVKTHFTASETIRDIVIGMSDGLTVPFALAAGLSGVVQSTGKELAAGAQGFCGEEWRGVFMERLKHGTPSAPGRTAAKRRRKRGR
jgi:VIT family protein